MLLSHTYHSGMSTLYYACTYNTRAEIEVAPRYRTFKASNAHAHAYNSGSLYARAYVRVRVRGANMAAYYTELAAKTWISPSKGTKLLLDHVYTLEMKAVLCKNHCL